MTPPPVVDFLRTGGDMARSELLHPTIQFPNVNQ